MSVHCACNTGVFSVFQVIPAARFEIRALDNVSEGKYDVSTEVGVDVFRQEFPDVRSVLRVATVVTEQLRIRATYSKRVIPYQNVNN